MKIDFDKYPSMIQFKPYHWPFEYKDKVTISVEINNAQIVIRDYCFDTNLVNSKYYEINDENMSRLLSFFSIEQIEDFLLLDNDELEKYETGYREFYGIRYHIFLYNQRPPIMNGNLRWYYSNNPMEMVLQWIRGTLPGVKKAII